MNLARTTLHLCAAIAACLLLTPPALADPPSFTGLGNVPDAGSGSQAYGISADGSAVVGQSGPAPYRGFRWTASDGMRNLGSLGEASGASAVSGDGSVVVGNSWHGGTL